MCGLQVNFRVGGAGGGLVSACERRIAASPLHVLRDGLAFMRCGLGRFSGVGQDRATGHKQ